MLRVTRPSRREQRDSASETAGTAGADAGEARYGFGDHWWQPLPEPAGAGGDPAVAGGGLLERVAEVYQVRYPDAAVTRHPWPGQRPAEHAGYLLFSQVGEHGRSPVSCVGVHDAPPTREAVARLRGDVLAQVPDGGADRDATLICRDDPDPGLRDWAAGVGVRVLGFRTFQLGDELARYAHRQAAELSEDPAYPPGLYVPQRFREPSAAPGAPPLGEPQDDLLSQVRHWFDTQRGVAVAVVGASGHGKSTLLRELARRMYADRDPAVPILIDLTRLDVELATRPDELIAVQLSRGGERRINLAEVRYLLREGRLALLCDGLDDLAAAVGRSGARVRWDDWGQVIAGHGKIVLVGRDRSLIAGIASLVAPYAAAARRRLAVLEDFNNEQALALFRQRLGAGPAGERFALLRQVEGLLPNARSPRTLGLLAEVDAGRLQAAVAGTGPATLAVLYEELINSWLAAELRRSWHDWPPELPTGRLRQVLTDLAVRLWVSEETSLDADELGAAADRLTRLIGSDDRWQQVGRGEVARLLAAGTLLTHDDEDRFAFVDRSAQQWLVARDTADRILDGVARRASSGPDPGAPLRAGGATVPEALRRAMPPLMVRFLCELAGAEAVEAWALAAEPSGDPGIRENANLILEQLGHPRG